MKKYLNSIYRRIYKMTLRSGLIQEYKLLIHAVNTKQYMSAIMLILAFIALGFNIAFFISFIQTFRFAFLVLSMISFVLYKATFYQIGSEIEK